MRLLLETLCRRKIDSTVRDPSLSLTALKEPFTDTDSVIGVQWGPTCDLREHVVEKPEKRVR